MFFIVLNLLTLSLTFFAIILWWVFCCFSKKLLEATDYDIRILSTVQSKNRNKETAEEIHESCS